MKTVKLTRLEALSISDELDEGLKSALMYYSDNNKYEEGFHVPCIGIAEILDNMPNSDIKTELFKKWRKALHG